MTNDQVRSPASKHMCNNMLQCCRPQICALLATKPGMHRCMCQIAADSTSPVAVRCDDLAVQLILALPDWGAAVWDGLPRTGASISACEEGQQGSDSTTSDHIIHCLVRAA